MKIERDLFDTLTDCKVGEDVDGYRVAANYHLKNKRWTELRRIVVIGPSSPEPYAFDYEQGLTENQELYFSDLYPEEVELFPVTYRAETVVFYDKV